MLHVSIMKSEQSILGWWISLMEHGICHPPSLTTSHSIMHANQIGTTSNAEARSHCGSYVSVCCNFATCRSSWI